jgi:hypothetical protein
MDLVFMLGLCEVIMKKVIQILFDDERGMPIFVLEDGTRRYAHETPTGNCWTLSWRIDEEEEAKRIEESVICDDCKHFVSMHHDTKGCLVTECPCAKE